MRLARRIAAAFVIDDRCMSHLRLSDEMTYLF
jgi:hypothetical protein